MVRAAQSGLSGIADAAPTLFGAPLRGHFHINQQIQTIILGFLLADIVANLLLVSRRKRGILTPRSAAR